MARTVGDGRAIVSAIIKRNPFFKVLCCQGKVASCIHTVRNRLFVSIVKTGGGNLLIMMWSYTYRFGDLLHSSTAHR